MKKLCIYKEGTPAYSAFDDAQDCEYAIVGAPDPTDSMYADRMRQWDYKKYDDAKMKVFGKPSDYLDEYRMDKLEEFISEYLKEKVILCSFVRTLNRSSGYPVYCFRYRKTK